jgi:hypothetical protein
MEVSMPTKTAAGYTVSGPDIEGRRFETAQVALSAAITLADHLDSEATFYVRDAHGEIVARAEHDADGVTRIYRLGKAGTR